MWQGNRKGKAWEEDPKTPKFPVPFVYPCPWKVEQELSRSSENSDKEKS
jgi:hypothetical protein